MKHLRDTPLDLLACGLVLGLCAVAFFVMAGFAWHQHQYPDAAYEIFIGLIPLGYAVACLWKRPHQFF